MRPNITEASPAYRHLLRLRDKKDKMPEAEYKSQIGEILVKYDFPLAEKMFEYICNRDLK